MATPAAAAPLTLARAVTRAMNKLAPLSVVESWDNVGLLLEAPLPKKEHRKVVLTIDLTSGVLEEVLDKHPTTSVVVSYHPPIFRGLKSLTLQNPLQRSLLLCAAHGISVYSPHTSLDACVSGINDWLAAGLGEAEECVPIQQVAGQPDVGVGRFVRLKQPLERAEVIRRVKAHLGLEHVQLASASSTPEIRTVAICAGSGGSVLSSAPPADLYLTGEMSHHELLAALASGTNIILTNHSNTERGYLRAVLQGKLQRELDAVFAEAGEKDGKCEVVVSDADRDPLEVV